jgi:hypothetical protein
MFSVTYDEGETDARDLEKDLSQSSQSVARCCFGVVSEWIRCGVGVGNPPTQSRKESERIDITGTCADDDDSGLGQTLQDGWEQGVEEPLEAGLKHGLSMTVSTGYSDVERAHIQHGSWRNPEDGSDDHPKFGDDPDLHDQ